MRGPSAASHKTDLDWMCLQVEGLFTYDDAGRMGFVDEQDGGRAPRFFLGRTPAGNLWRFRDDLTPRTVADLTALCETEPVVDTSQLSRHGDAYREVLEETAPIERAYAGPAYHFPEEIPVPSHQIVALSEANAGLLEADFPDWVEDTRHRPLIFGLLHEGRVVSICASVRTTAEGHEAGVETLASERGRGFAPAVVAGWARAVRALGAEPIYGTGWENLASRAVARKLGLVMFGEDFHLT